MSWAKKTPQEAPGTIFETQGREWYPANGFLKERELWNLDPNLNIKVGQTDCQKHQP